MIKTTVTQDLKKLEQIKGRIPVAAANYVNRKLEEIRQEVVFSIGTPYPPASNPGDPPHRRSGDLKASIRVVKATVGSGVSKGFVYSPLYYAKFLEVGTRRMSARPFLSRANEIVRKRSLLDNQATQFVREIS